MNTPQQTEMKEVVWKSTYLNTTELLTIKSGETIRADGFITGEAKGNPLHLHYTIELDSGWNLISAEITETSAQKRKLSYRRDEAGNWYENGNHIPGYDHISDIDIIYTPFTNTLPINRLNLAVGETAEIVALYFNLPVWKVEPVTQLYTRLADRYYKYENPSSDFSTILKVDEDGLVTDYPGIWKRIIPTDKTEKKNIRKPSGHFIDALASNSQERSIPEAEDIYASLIGSWDVTIVDYYPDRSISLQEAEWHFARVLGGRTVQDVLISNAFLQKREGGNRTRSRYGTSLRTWNPSNNCWEITWANPTSGALDRLKGMKENGDIVQTGTDADGNIMRWVFTGIGENRFRWYGERSVDNGKSWIVEAEFFAIRRLASETE